jgi:hypothetical protein
MFTTAAAKFCGLKDRNLQSKFETMSLSVQFLPKSCQFNATPMAPQQWVGCSQKLDSKQLFVPLTASTSHSDGQTKTHALVELTL